MATRPVRFELHIRPLMRLIDHDNMTWRMDLWSYDQVRADAPLILQRLQADMPPTVYGGQWPEEWIALFQRWMNEGFGRLDLGTVDAPGYTAARNGMKVTISGRGTVPASGYRTWLEAVLVEGGPREYVHWWEPPEGAPAPSPTVFRAKATFEPPAGTIEVAVTDATGRHLVPIP